MTLYEKHSDQQLQACPGNDSSKSLIRHSAFRSRDTWNSLPQTSVTPNWHKCLGYERNARASARVFPSLPTRWTVG